MKASQFSENAQLLAFVLQPGAEWLPEVIDTLDVEGNEIHFQAKGFSVG